MSQQTKKRSWLSSLSPRTRVLIGVGIIFALVILALFFAPPEGDANNVTGDLPATPTVSITNLVESVTINRNITYNGVQITIQKAMLATKFSDDHRPFGTYTVRVMVQTVYHGPQPVGVKYASVVHLVLPDGQVIAPKFVSVLPVQMPDKTQTGFFDFPVASQVPLSSLTLHFDNNTTVAFGG